MYPAIPSKRVAHRMFKPCRFDQHDDCAGETFEDEGERPFGSPGSGASTGPKSHLYLRVSWVAVVTQADERVDYSRPDEPRIMVPLSEWAVMRELVLLLARRHWGEAYRDWSDVDFLALEGLKRQLEVE